MKLPNNTTDIDVFFEHWGEKPTPGMKLEIYDTSNGGVYDCTVDRIEQGRIFIKREDRNYVEYATVASLQTIDDSEEDDF